MQSLLIAAAGALLLLYSLLQIAKILETVYWGYIKKPWSVLFFLVLLFLLGIGFYEYILLSGTAHSINDALFSAIIFYASVLVMLAIRVSYKTVEDMKAIEYNIATGMNAAQISPPSTDKLQRDLEIKNDDLGKILAELYALKDALGEIKSGKPEMARLRKILDNLSEHRN